MREKILGPKEYQEKVYKDKLDKVVGELYAQAELLEESDICFCTKEVSVKALRDAAKVIILADLQLYPLIKVEEDMQKNWQKAENKAAKDTGMKATPRSGAGNTLKADAFNKDFSMEVKYSSALTDNGEPKITIKREWFDKVSDQANRLGKEPVMAFVVGVNKKYMFYFRKAITLQDIAEKVGPTYKTIQLKSCVTLDLDQLIDTDVIRTDYVFWVKTDSEALWR
jgi:hypothetical protein